MNGDVVKPGFTTSPMKEEKKMKHGFVKVAAATPDIRVADVKFNTGKICEAIGEASDNRAKVIVFPELCVTGSVYTGYPSERSEKGALQDSGVYGRQRYPCLCGRTS